MDVYIMLPCFKVKKRFFGFAMLSFYPSHVWKCILLTRVPVECAEYRFLRNTQVAKFFQLNCFPLLLSTKAFLLIPANVFNAQTEIIHMWVHDLFIQHILAKGSHILFPRRMIAISQDILPFLSGGWNVISITNETGREMVGEQYQDRTFTEVCGGVARDSRVGLRDSGRLVYSGRIGTLAHLHRVGVRVTSGSVGALGDPCTLTPLPPSCFIPFQYHSELTPPKCSWVQAWDSPYIIQIKH